MMKKYPTLIEQLKSNEAEIKAHREAAYLSYGRFAIEFEVLANTIRWCIINYLEILGLKRREAGELLVSDMSMSDLVKKCRALVSLHADGKRIANNDIKYLEPLFKNTIEIYQLRNKLIHGTWYVPDFGRTLTGDFVSIEGKRNSTTANGLKTELFKISVEDLDGWSSAIESAIDAYTNLASCLSNDKVIQEQLPIQKIEKSKLPYRLKGKLKE